MLDVTEFSCPEIRPFKVNFLRYFRSGRIWSVQEHLVWKMSGDQGPWHQVHVTRLRHWATSFRVPSGAKMLWSKDLKVDSRGFLEKKHKKTLRVVEYCKKSVMLVEIENEYFTKRSRTTFWSLSQPNRLLFVTLVHTWPSNIDLSSVLNLKAAFVYQNVKPLPRLQKFVPQKTFSETNTPPQILQSAGSKDWLVSRVCRLFKPFEVGRKLGPFFWPVSSSFLCLLAWNLSVSRLTEGTHGWLSIGWVQFFDT